MQKLPTKVKAEEVHENAIFWHNRAEHNLYRFFLEVKEVRDEKLFHELGFKSFDDYCQSAWNLKRRVVDERIQIADSFSEEDFKRYSAQMGHKKTLLLSSMDEYQREKALSEGVPTDKGYKPYDEATQKEIADWKRDAEEAERKAKEYEKQLKQREEKIEQQNDQLTSTQRENDILQSKLESAENKEPEIVERYTEPEDYEELKENIQRMERQGESLSEKNKRLMEEISDMRNRRSEMDEKSKKYDELTQAINEMDNRLTEGQVRIKNQKLVYDLVQRSEDLIKEVAPLIYAIDHLDVEDNEYAKKPLLKIAKSLDDITKKIYRQLNENQIIEVE